MDVTDRTHTRAPAVLISSPTGLPWRRLFARAWPMWTNCRVRRWNAGVIARSI